MPHARLPKLGLPDLVASVTGAVVSVPDGMAASVIVGVNPVHGLYASAFGPIIGGLTSRSPLLVITTTGSGALAAAEVVEGVSGDDRVAALLLITFLCGAFQLLAALIGLTRLTEFVSYSVMTGFLTGIAVLIIPGRLGTLLGYEPQGSNSIAQTADLLRHVSEISAATTLTGLFTLALIFGLQRTPLRPLGPLVALLVPSVIVAQAGVSGIPTVQDVAPIPSSVPTAALPDFSFLSAWYVTGALAVAAIIFVQTAGVSQSLPNANVVEGPAADLRASGIANIGTAVFQGQPVGGSLGGTSLNLQAGARSRLASVLAGIWVLAIIVLFSGLVEKIAMPSLAALLIVAAVGAIKMPETVSIWHTGWGSRITILVTFVLTLVLPIQIAILLAVALSAVLYLGSAAADVHLQELVQLPDGRLEEKAAPQDLQTESVVVLQVYGSLFFAGARTLERRLPAVGDAHHAIVVLRLRGISRLGATAIDVLSRYARSLHDNDGRLFLAGLSPALSEQLGRTGRLQRAEVHLYRASPVIGESLARSYSEAQTWLVRHDAVGPG